MCPIYGFQNAKRNGTDACHAKLKFIAKLEGSNSFEVLTSNNFYAACFSYLRNYWNSGKAEVVFSISY